MGCIEEWIWRTNIWISLEKVSQNFVCLQIRKCQQKAFLISAVNILKFPFFTVKTGLSGPWECIKSGNGRIKFEKYTLDLYEYIYEMLTEYFRNYQGNDFGKKTGVGKFVQDVIERRTTDEREIDACLEKLKLKSSNADGYQMAILYNTEKNMGRSLVQ